MEGDFGGGMMVWTLLSFDICDFENHPLRMGEGIQSKVKNQLVNCTSSHNHTIRTTHLETE